MALNTQKTAEDKDYSDRRGYVRIDLKAMKKKGFVVEQITDDQVDISFPSVSIPILDENVVELYRSLGLTDYDFDQVHCEASAGLQRALISKFIK